MSRPTRESGQATVEFALIIPLVVMVLMAIAQLAVIAYTQLAVTHLSHEVARALAIDPSADIGRLVNDRSLLSQDGLRIETQIISTHGESPATIEVRVTYDAVAISEIFHRFLGDVTLSAEARMVMELQNFP